MNDPMGTAEHISKTPAEISAALKAQWDRYTVPTLPEIAADHPHREVLEEDARRRQMSAALRMLATFIEDHPRLPVPDAVHLQYSELNGDRDHRIGVVRAAAEELGVEPRITETHATVTRRFGGRWDRFEYCVHAKLPEITQADVAAALLES